MPLDELEKWQEWQIPSSLMKLLHGSAEISIVETSSSGARTWVISDVDGLRKPFQLRSRGWMLRSDYWIHADDYIENGKLISARKMFVGAMGGKVDRDGPRWAKVDKGLVMEHLDSFSTDKKGNLVREFICSIPIPNIKITKVMSALRVVSSDRSSLRQCCVLS